MQIKAPKFLLSFVAILAIIWTTNCNSLPALATNYFPALTTKETSSIRKLEEPVALEDLGTEPIPTPTQEQLLKLSIHLRDAARYLGASLPVTVTLYEPLSKSWRFTDIKDSNGWTTLTVGQALKLVTQELEVIKARETQPVIALLLKDELAERYLPVRLPLNLYCYKLSESIKLPATFRHQS
ncbi:hypothetical protein [Scytonema millei]|uniref:Uncharacterized protein n=1 Tax=Scytonema millei VB511283 TaxID=1245923 RepID=A0A9X5E8G4_9CYAN|nr:hypothetical protein [Scytonema millei]NHC35967.1 hypothetical protein [Scytonema millei VB511283]